VVGDHALLGAGGQQPRAVAERALRRERQTEHGAAGEVQPAAERARLELPQPDRAVAVADTEEARLAVDRQGVDAAAVVLRARPVLGRAAPEELAARDVPQLDLPVRGPHQALAAGQERDRLAGGG